MARKRSNSSHWSSMSIDIDRHRDHRHADTHTTRQHATPVYRMPLSRAIVDGLEGQPTPPT